MQVNACFGGGGTTFFRGWSERDEIISEHFQNVAFLFDFVGCSLVVGQEQQQQFHGTLNTHTHTHTHTRANVLSSSKSNLCETNGTGTLGGVK